MWPRDCCEQGSSCRTGSAEMGKGTKIPNKVWLVQAENLFSALLYTWSGYNDMQWSQISPVQKLSCGSRSLMMVRHWFVCAEGKHAWQKKKKRGLVKGTDFLIVLFEFRSSLMLPSGVFLTSFLSPRHGCISSGWYLWHKHKGDTYSQHRIWLFPTTPVIQQPQGLEDTSVSRCSSCHLHELHYLTALALINICCNLW